MKVGVTLVADGFWSFRKNNESLCVSSRGLGVWGKGRLDGVAVSRVPYSPEKSPSPTKPIERHTVSNVDKRFAFPWCSRSAEHRPPPLSPAEASVEDVPSKFVFTVHCLLWSRLLVACRLIVVAHPQKPCRVSRPLSGGCGLHPEDSDSLQEGEGLPVYLPVLATRLFREPDPFFKEVLSGYVHLHGLKGLV